jgi:hypothetical protein
VFDVYYDGFSNLSVQIKQLHKPEAAEFISGFKIIESVDIEKENHLCKYSVWSHEIQTM